MTEKPIEPPASVAVIGLGNMGSPMALCLSRASFRVTGFDLSEAARQKFSESGGRIATDARDAAKDADAVITLLPDGKIVKAALDGLRPHLKKGTLVIDMSSSEPLGTAELGATFIAEGFPFLDAPVSGGVRRAVDGTLSIMVGGDAQTIERAMPILNAMGRTIFRTGKLGSGHAMKAINNYVSAAGLVAAVEGIAIGKTFGLDPDLMADILNASTGRNNTTEVKLKQFILSQSFAAGFPLKLMAKDVRTADALARALNVPTPFADICADLWDQAAQALEPGIDHTAIGLYLEKTKR